LRRDNEALRIGRYFPDVIDERALVFVRRAEDRQALVALNFTDQPVELKPKAGGGKILLSTHGDRQRETAGRSLRLRGNEGVIVDLS
ncbi:MAG: DUF3459 domain-containing protein, partial [Pirellulales bacterium]|nr:DUF3459 domain-containing protein [Pirellulales bacterium]